jgi:ribonuclease PH
LWVTGWSVLDIEGITVMNKKNPAYKREDGRKEDELRPVKFKKDMAPAAAGSVLIKMGHTQVLCAASVEETVPRWKRVQKVPGGWITAEYSLLPYATKGRTRREASMGKVGGRTQEIQRLIGRSLRAVVDLEALGNRTIWVDCDVLEADGGTRTAAVTGGFVALKMAINKLLEQGLLKADPVTEAIAAVSVGVVEGTPVLDLNYTEDFAADVDMNVVMTASGKFVEVQGTAEEQPFSKTTMQELLRLAEKGIKSLVVEQETLLG